MYVLYVCYHCVVNKDEYNRFLACKLYIYQIFLILDPTRRDPRKTETFVTQPDQTQPDPWMDLTHVQLWLKSARSHMMPPPLHLSNIRCKGFPYLRCHDKQLTLLKGAVNERTNEAAYVGC